MSVVQIGTSTFLYLRLIWYRLVQHPLGVYLLYQGRKQIPGVNPMIDLFGLEQQTQGPPLA